jgi:hypothetical protein
LAYDGAPNLRQGWVEFARGPVQARAGRQIIAWGRADRLNPTDNLSPRNTPALVADIDEDRIGIDALSLRVQFGERWTLGAIHAIRPRATVLPASIGTLPARFGGPGLAGLASDRDMNALRLDFAGSQFDASLSAVRGPALLPAFITGPTLAARQPMVRIIGADFSMAINDRWGLRGEFADTRFDDATPAGLGDFRYLVIGAERHIDGGWLALAQFVRRRADRTTAAAPSLAATLNRAIWFQAEADSDAIYLGLSRAPFEADLSGDIGVLQTLDNRGRAWFANLEYRFDDHWNAYARLQHFSGPADSNIGVLRKDTLFLLELRYSIGWQR